MVVKNVKISTVAVNAQGAHQQLGLTIEWTLANIGRIKANNCCVVTTGDYGSFSTERGVTQTVQARSTHWRTWFWELQYPIYPEMETSFNVMCYVTTRMWQPAGGKREDFVQPPAPGIAEQCIEAIVISWKLFADSAPPKSGRRTLGEMGVRTVSWLPRR